MNKVSRVGQCGDLIVYGRTGRMRSVALVKVLDDTAAAVWEVLDLETGEVFKAMSSNIRFYR